MNHLNRKTKALVISINHFGNHAVSVSHLFNPFKVVCQSRLLLRVVIVWGKKLLSTDIVALETKAFLLCAVFISSIIMYFSIHDILGSWSSYLQTAAFKAFVVAALK